MRIYCDLCGEYAEFDIDQMRTDELNEKPWGDIVCRQCRLVIATIVVDEPGLYAIEKVGELA